MPSTDQVFWAPFVLSPLVTSPDCWVDSLPPTFSRSIMTAGTSWAMTQGSRAVGRLCSSVQPSSAPVVNFFSSTVGEGPAAVDLFPRLAGLEDEVDRDVTADRDRQAGPDGRLVLVQLRPDDVVRAREDRGEAEHAGRGGDGLQIGGLRTGQGDLDARQGFALLVHDPALHQAGPELCRQG